VLRFLVGAVSEDQRGGGAAQREPEHVEGLGATVRLSKPQRSPGKHRLYTHGEIAALRDALHEGLSISSAVSRAREGLSADAETLVAALSGFDRDRADGALEGCPDASVAGTEPLKRSAPSAPGRDSGWYRAAPPGSGVWTGCTFPFVGPSED
jgi:hypothetical protein